MDVAIKTVGSRSIMPLRKWMLRQGRNVMYLEAGVHRSKQFSFDLTADEMSGIESRNCKSIWIWIRTSSAC